MAETELVLGASLIRGMQGVAKGWMKQASKVVDPFMPSVTVTEPLTAQQKAAAKARLQSGIPVITIQVSE